jgi:hypothetical protein
MVMRMMSISRSKGVQEKRTLCGLLARVMQGLCGASGGGVVDEEVAACFRHAIFLII